MVKIKNGILGTPRGKIGKIVYRHMNGNTFASDRPEKYNQSQSEKSKSNRGRFAAAIQFAKYISSIPELSKIWKYAKIKGTTSFNKLVKHNIKAINNKLLTVNNIITPGLGKGVAYFEDITVNKNLVRFKMKLDENLLTEETTHPIQIFAVLAFQEPKSINDPVFLITHLSEEKSKQVIITNNEIRMELSEPQRKISENFNSCLIYIAAVVDSENPKEIAYSSSYAESFNFE